MLILSQNTQFLREILVFSYFIGVNPDAWTMFYPRNLSGRYNSSWSAHFPFTRLAHFYPFVSSDPFPTGVQFTTVPSVELSVSPNFRPLCPYSIILIIQVRLRVGRGCIRVNNEWSKIMKNSSFHRTVENDENCITSQWAVFNPLLLIQFVLENARFLTNWVKIEFWIGLQVFDTLAWL